VAVITEGRVADVRVARELRFEPGTILIMERGSVDFTWFDRPTANALCMQIRTALIGCSCSEISSSAPRSANAQIPEPVQAHLAFSPTWIFNRST
jgi:hypothetical protein